VPPESIGAYRKKYIDRSFMPWSAEECERLFQNPLELRVEQRSDGFWQASVGTGANKVYQSECGLEERKQALHFVTEVTHWRSNTSGLANGIDGVFHSILFVIAMR